MQNHLNIAKQLLEVSLAITNQSQEKIYEITSSYIKIAEAYQQLAQDQEAAKVIQTALELNRQPNNYPYSFSSLEELAEYLLKNNRQSKAIELLHQALSIAKQESDCDERDNMLVRLGDKYGMAEAYELALECAELIEDDFDQISLYKYLSWNYIDHQNHEQARIIIEKAESSGWNDWFLEDVVGSYLKHEDFARAFEAFEKMTQEQAKVTALSDIAQKYWELGNESAAVESLTKAQEITDRIPDSNTKSWCLQAMSRVAEKISTTQESESLLSASVNEAQQINDQFSQGFAFNNLAFQLVSAGKYDEAIKLIETSNPFIPKFQKVRLLIAIANQCQKLNQPTAAEEMINRAMKTVEEITGIDEYLTSEKAQSLAWHDITDYALEHRLYALAQEISKEIKSPDAQVNLLVKISTAYIKNNEFEQARTTLQQATEILPNVEAGMRLGSAMSVASNYGEMGDYHLAIKSIKLIPRNAYQARTLAAIALKYAESPQPLQPDTLQMIETWI
jgi:tetratricopeptide (TPR) repeat protein